jgi:hypothetical protein
MQQVGDIIMKISGRTSAIAFGLLAASSLAIPTAASAQSNRSISGASKGLAWTASNMIVGVDSTATVAGGGNPLYFANKPQYSGVVTLIMQYNGVGAFICTGSLVGRNKVVTAAHCVSDGYGSKGPDKVTAYFSDSSDPDLVRFGPGFVAAPGAIAIDSSYVHVNPGYTGQVIDQNDIAVITLASNAPSYAKAYDFYFEDDLSGQSFNVVGNGRRSDVGGDVGANLGTGRMRQGENIYDYALGDAIWGGFWDGFFGSADVTNSWLSDFDNASPQIIDGELFVGNDQGCIIGVVLTGTAFGCNPYLGDIEVGVAGGDSGGPQFLNGKLASVTSYGLTFGADFGDIDDALNSSFGEFSGYVPIYAHEDWLKSVVPEPATWAMMIAGVGLVGTMMRRRRTAVAA